MAVHLSIHFVVTFTILMFTEYTVSDFPDFIYPTFIPFQMRYSDDLTYDYLPALSLMAVSARLIAGTVLSVLLFTFRSKDAIRKET